MSPAEEKLEAQRARIQRLTAKLKKEEHALKQKREREATRRKILWGAYFMQQMEEQPPETREKARAGLERFLTRDADRKLFGFPCEAETQKDPTPGVNA